ncbi:MAG TPA: hypothetical protein VL944_02130 [Candidatus Acidoferrum sp.]|nr:hypothetical protein [Candidatus Acidoferrum sp.]
MVKIKENKMATELSEHPDKKHWESFAAYLKKSKAKYYKVFFPKKLKKLKDLKSAYAVIYDSRYVPMFSIPIIMKTAGKVQGATIYLKGLINTNKDYKEWVAA